MDASLSTPLSTPLLTPLFAPLSTPLSTPLLTPQVCGNKIDAARRRAVSEAEGQRWAAARFGWKRHSRHVSTPDTFPLPPRLATLIYGRAPVGMGAGAVSEAEGARWAAARVGRKHQTAATWCVWLTTALRNRTRRTHALRPVWVSLPPPKKSQAAARGATYFETSAKDGAGVAAMFDALFRQASQALMAVA